MDHLARWIRRGLEHENVVETRLIRGIAHQYPPSNGIYVAGIVGLALIGKVGLLQAFALFAPAERELRREPGGGPHTQAICRELGITVEDMNVLNRRHMEYKARTIADGLEAETDRFSHGSLL